MAKVPILVDTDVFIDYLNTGRFSSLFDGPELLVYYSVVTKKELLGKPGLRDSERRALLAELRRFRMIGIAAAIAARYGELRIRYPRMDKEDALIAATALDKNLPLVTRNRRHFRQVLGLVLFAV